VVHTRIAKAFLVLGVLIATSEPGLAQTPSAPPPDRITQAPARRIQFGVDQRTRNEDWNNLFDYSDSLNDQRRQMRYRTMVWATVPLGAVVDFAAGLNSESTVKQCPGALPSACVNRMDEFVFDRFYLDVRKLFRQGLALRLGRQNIQEGEGFLFLEGDPGDGSKSVYFNAVNLSYAWNKSKLELIGIYDPKTDKWLPKIHEYQVNGVNHKPLNDWDDKAVGVYYTDRNRPKTGYEAYYFYKREVNDHKAYLAAVIQPDRHIHTLGGRVIQAVTPSVSLTGEWAQQWGAQHDGKSISAWGGYGYVTKKFDRAWKPYIVGGYWAMSGADPASTTVNGNFDPIFARWPKFSELYLYSQLREYGIGMNTNINQAQAEMGISPWKPISWRLTYFRMGAYHPFPGNPAIFGAGTSRGDLVVSRLDYTINKYWSGHTTIEHMTPGDFYKARNPSYFVQIDFSYRFLFSAPMPKM